MKKTKFTILILLLLLTFVSCKKQKKENDTKNTTETATINETPTYSPLDGSPLSKEDMNQPVIGIMLDNHPKARQQSGFNKASIIYEFKVEGDFTRYLALFYNSDAEQIGPVRSARPYFVNTISEYNGIYAHFGGSTLGMSKISDLKVDNLDGMQLEGKTFKRNSKTGKKAPHNAYTSMELINSAIKEKGYETKRDFKGFNFDLEGKDIESQMAVGTSAMNITIPTTPSYKVNFKYDEANKKYDISRNNVDMIDEFDQEKVKATNIIIQYADSKVIGAGGILEISHVGTGNGKLITNGKVIDIKWNKETENGKTIFTTENNNEIILSPGQTWIEVVDTNTNITIE
ncbi:DUF3048 domain-containing protein [Miniphocaeibacter massiliensis]|uniref:DUF3048 domain-containing protein n=1 Tax=Miniphocaeibacter massiliensis TaxID=2041841 RepID=UPI000C1C7B64|nr:DUF3048 domain-containing protein [Miniphocaeibacter massiliensis]